MMRYVIQPYVPGFGPITPMVVETEEDAGDLARDYLRQNNQGVCVVTMRNELLDPLPALTLSVYAGVNCPIVF